MDLWPITSWDLLAPLNADAAKKTSVLNTKQGIIVTLVFHISRDLANSETVK